MTGARSQEQPLYKNGKKLHLKKTLRTKSFFIISFFLSFPAKIAEAELLRRRAVGFVLLSFHSELKSDQLTENFNHSASMHERIFNKHTIRRYRRLTRFLELGLSSKVREDNKAKDSL